MQLTNYILGITGHFIPTGPQWRKFFAEFFRDPFGPIVSPSPPVKEEEELYIPPPADAYAIRNFPIGKILPMRDLESEEEEEGMSDGSETLDSWSSGSGRTTPSSGYYSSLE